MLTWRVCELSLCRRLAEEVLAFAKYSWTCGVSQRALANLTITRVRSVVQEVWPHATVDVFGSLATGLWLPGCDVDLVVRVRAVLPSRASLSVPAVVYSFVRHVSRVMQRGDGKLRAGASSVACLSRLAKRFRALPYFSSVKLIDTAKIPVLKLVVTGDKGDKATPVSVDITVDADCVPHSGLAAWCAAFPPSTRHTLHSHSCFLSCCSRMIRQYAAQLPEFRPLMFVVKHFLKQHGLNIPYQGGLSSYSLSLMMIGFLQLVCLRQGKPAVNVDVSSWMRTAESESDGCSSSDEVGRSGCRGGDDSDDEWSDGAEGGDAEPRPDTEPVVHLKDLQPPSLPAVPAALLAYPSDHSATDTYDDTDEVSSSAGSSSVGGSARACDAVTVDTASSVDCVLAGVDALPAGLFEEHLFDEVSATNTATGLTFGQLLVEFLEFYGQKFDASKWGLSVRVRMLLQSCSPAGV